MFLTRIGFNSKAVITGDPSQVDLPRNVRSGLRHAMEVLAHVDAIAFTYFVSDDVVRHPVVAAIVNAYDAYEQKERKREEQEGNTSRGRGYHRDYYRSYDRERFSRDQNKPDSADAEAAATESAATEPAVAEPAVAEPAATTTSAN